MSGGISRLRPPSESVNALTLPLTVTGSAPELEQLIDLGQVRVAYVEVLLVAHDDGGEVFGPSPGELYWSLDSILQGREASGMSIFTGSGSGDGTWDPISNTPVPFTMKTITGATPRFLEVKLALNVRGADVWPGGGSAAGDFTVYVEYV